MGESKLKLAKREEMLLSCAGVQTMAGRIQVRWETESSATPMGQLAYFVEFLNLIGLWARWLESCPVSYASPNAPSKAEVLGTWMLSMLAGHRRYSHVTTIRCDGINPGLLGMRKVISEDALRNALKRIPETEGTHWIARRASPPSSQRIGLAAIRPSQAAHRRPVNSRQVQAVQTRITRTTRMSWSSMGDCTS